eukprot:1498725-Prymnesium_polylepis.2
MEALTRVRRADQPAGEPSQGYQRECCMHRLARTSYRKHDGHRDCQNRCGNREHLQDWRPPPSEWSAQELRVPCSAVNNRARLREREQAEQGCCEYEELVLIGHGRQQRAVRAHRQLPQVWGERTGRVSFVEAHHAGGPQEEEDPSSKGAPPAARVVRERLLSERVQHQPSIQHTQQEHDTHSSRQRVASTRFNTAEPEQARAGEHQGGGLTRERDSGRVGGHHRFRRAAAAATVDCTLKAGCRSDGREAAASNNQEIDAHARLCICRGRPADINICGRQRGSTAQQAGRRGTIARRTEWHAR